MPTIPTHWYLSCQRAIWAIRRYPKLKGILMFNRDRVRLIGYYPMEMKGDNDNV